MFAGHFGLALAAKRATPRTSLGTLFLGAQLLDLVWPVFLIVGIEQVRIVPGLMAASPFDFVHYPWTHSLLMACAWGMLVGGIYFAARRDARGAAIVGALVVSHWVLDFPMHRPDLPLWPGGPVVGLGLWRSIPITLLLEAILFGGGALAYARATVAHNRIGSIGYGVLVAFIAVAYLSVVFGPPPADAHAMAWTTLVMWLFVPVGAWIDRHRTLRTAAA